MNYKKLTINLVFIFLGLGALHAQKGLTYGGGEAKGSGDIVSYSIGQAVYTTNKSNLGSMAQDVQQSFDLEAIDELIEMSVYPNPTTNYLILEVENTDMLSYRLFDIRGKLIEIPSHTKSTDYKTHLFKTFPDFNIPSLFDTV